MKSQIVTSSWGGRRYLPNAFTEHGVAMLSSVLQSECAVYVNIAIMRTFVQLRKLSYIYAELLNKIEIIERKYDKQFRVVFDVIRQLIESPKKTEGEFGLNLREAQKNLSRILPKKLSRAIFVRALNTKSFTQFPMNYLFNSIHSFERGFRFNYKRTYPVLYLAGDQVIASLEIGPKTYEELLPPNLKMEHPPYLYFSVRITANVLDLTTEHVRKALHTSLEEIIIPTHEWEEKMKMGIKSITHQIGQLAYSDRRFDGILYSPSPASSFLDLKNKYNLALFMDPGSPEMSTPRGLTVVIKVVDNQDFIKKLKLEY